MTKQTLRQQSLSCLKMLTPDHIDAASSIISHALSSLSSYKSSQHIACFFPMPLEPQIQPFLSQALEDKKLIYLPVINIENHMHYAEFKDEAHMTKNQFGIAEPLAKATVDPGIFDWILVPLVCFDKTGHRIGHGAGFYDRFFADHPTCRAKRIGVGFACQEVEHITPDPWDQPLDCIVTETSNKLINTP